MLTETDINKALAATDNLASNPRARPPKELRNSRASAPARRARHPGDLIGNQLVRRAPFPMTSWSSWSKTNWRNGN